MYRFFDKYLPIEQAGDWKDLASKFNQVAGYTFLGDLILHNDETKQFALLFTINPELVPLEFFDIDEFVEDYLKHETVEKHVLQVDKVKQLRAKIGDLNDGQVYIAEPYLFLGGDASVDSYSKGDLWPYLEIIGGMQGISD